MGHSTLRGKGRYVVKLQVKPVRRYLIVRGRSKCALPVRFINKQTGFKYLADARIVAYWLNKPAMRWIPVRLGR